MQIVLLFLCVALVWTQGLDQHMEIERAVDSTFRRLDLNQDGLMELYEFEDGYAYIDANHDHRISLNEYIDLGANHTFGQIVFRQMDYDGDGYLDSGAIYGQYTVMDTNHDDEVSRTEYDVYFTEVVEAAIKNYGHLLPSGTDAPVSKPVQ